ncbi:MAG: hypothetical protein WBJ23_02400 [Anaerolineaceae bacterium]
MSYNGYENYQTWAVALWLDNDESTSELISDIIKRARSDYDAADQLRDLIEEMNPLADQASMFTDILNSALSDVKYIEIIKSHKEE